MAYEVLGGFATGLAGVPGVQQRVAGAVRQEELMGIQRKVEGRRETKHQMEMDIYNRTLRELEKNEKTMDNMNEWVKATFTPDQIKEYGIGRNNFTNDAKGRVLMFERLNFLSKQQKDIKTLEGEYEDIRIEPSPRETVDKWNTYLEGVKGEAKRKKALGGIKEEFVAEKERTGGKPLRKGRATEIIGVERMGLPGVGTFIGGLSTEEQAIRAERAERGGLTREDIEVKFISPIQKAIETAKYRVAQLKIRSKTAGLSKKEEADIIKDSTDIEMLKKRLKSFEKAKVIFLSGKMTWEEALDKAEGILGVEEGRGMLKPERGTTDIFYGGMGLEKPTGIPTKIPIGGMAEKPLPTKPQPSPKTGMYF